MMKKHKAFFFFCIALLCCIGPINGEEYIRNISSIAGSNTIIRDVDATRFLVCGGKASGDCSFTLVTNGAPSHYEMTIMADSVLDFEVYNGSDVYFCGRINNGNGIYAMLGHFSLSGFPNSTVEYVSLPWLYRLKKMDIGWFANKMHVVAIGDAIAGNGVLVDAIIETTSWDINYAFIDTVNDCRFSDVAITDSFVVATSTYKGSLFRSSRIWYVQKPASSGSPIQFNTCKYLNINEKATEPLLIEKCEGNVFVTATKDPMVLHFPSYSTPPSHFFYVKAFSTYQLLHSVRWDLDNFIYPKLKDICYDPINRILDCLIYTGNNSSQHNVIYHLDQTLSQSPGTSHGHSYDNIIINSLDRKASQSKHFIAVGNSATDTWGSYLLKYKYDVWGSCFASEDISVFHRTNSISPISKALSRSHILLLPLTLDIDKKNHPIETLCHSNKQ